MTSHTVCVLCAGTDSVHFIPVVYQSLLFINPCSTSHEIKRVSVLEQEACRPLLDGVQQYIKAHRARALNPAHPSHRGSAQSHEVLMQAWEGTNSFYQVIAGACSTVSSESSRQDAASLLQCCAGCH